MPPDPPEATQRPPGPPQPLRWLARRAALALAPDLRALLDHLERALDDLDPPLDDASIDRARTEVTLARRLLRGDRG